MSVDTLTPRDVMRHLRLRTVRRALARSRLLARDATGVWRGFLPEFPPSPDFVVGLQTQRICEELEAATFAVERGECYFSLIMCPVRHGKSSLICGRYPAWHLGRNPDHEIMMGSYTHELVSGFSLSCRNTVESEDYGLTFDGLTTDHSSRASARWKIQGHRGGVNAFGLTGSITGKGAHIMLIDDPHKGWAETRNKSNRDKVWNTFLNDCFSRLAPAHAVIVLMSPMHPDDMVSRIEAAMKDRPGFPQFNVVRMGARDPSYPSGYLFPERYSAEWYERMYATLTPSQASAMLDCRPTQEGGHRFNVDAIKLVDAHEVPEGLSWTRYWDLASSEDERGGDDPDYTVGSLVAIEYRDEKREGVEVRVPHVWVRDVVRGQWEAPARDRRIRETSLADGPAVTVVLESVAGYKDTAVRIEAQLRGISAVSRDTKTVSKAVRAEAFEPVVDAGNCHLLRAEWNVELVAELAAFPEGKHDDMVDTITGALAHAGESDLWISE